MAREARIVLPGVAHHITQRGNNRQDVFFNTVDRRLYLELLRASAMEEGLCIHGYCLMTNHIHLIAVPETETSLARAIGRTHQNYAQYLNGTYGLSGHTWQNRFYSCPMDEAHAQNALAYVELNPVRAGLIQRPWEYTWSSAAHHCGKRSSRSAAYLSEHDHPYTPEGWKETLRTIYRDTEWQNTMRKHTTSGRPLGSDAFLKSIEDTLGRSVRLRSVGRPKTRGTGPI